MARFCVASGLPRINGVTGVFRRVRASFGSPPSALLLLALGAIQIRWLLRALRMAQLTRDSRWSIFWTAWGGTYADSFVHRLRMILARVRNLIFAAQRIPAVFGACSA